MIDQYVIATVAIKYIIYTANGEGTGSMCPPPHKHAPDKQYNWVHI